MKRYILKILLPLLLLLAACFNDGGGEDYPSYPYKTPEEINTYLNDINAAYPAITAIETVGTSVDGRPIRAIIISDNPGTLEGEPAVRLTGGIHGNEKMSVELLVRFIEYLTANYGSDSTVTNLIDSRYICIIPVLNPDGLSAGSRYNSNGVDLNRNFDDSGNHWVSDSHTGSAAFSEPETSQFVTYSTGKSFNISITYHVGAVLVNLPFDFGKESELTYPSQNVLVKSYAKTYSLAGTFLDNPDLYVSPYMDEGTINGGDWYIAYGTLQDWSYTVTQCLDLTIEVAKRNPDNEEGVEQVFIYNRDSIIAYITRAGEDTFDGVVVSP